MSKYCWIIAIIAFLVGLGLMAGGYYVYWYVPIGRILAFITAAAFIGVALLVGYGLYRLYGIFFS
ncbi:hypothetical protein ACXWTF_12910 [Thiomicrolovo sp. ZZH C-3]